MKKLISFILCVCFVCSFSCVPTYAEENNDFQSQLSEMIRRYEEDDYFSVIGVKIGESGINIDGEIVPIDDGSKNLRLSMSSFIYCVNARKFQ